jgi:WD40 repeat protein
LFDIELYDIKNQIWIRPEDSHSAGYDKPVFSPCGQFIAGTGQTRKIIKIWDVNTLKPTVFCETTNDCSLLEYSPCGRFLALGLSTGTIEIRKVETGKCVRRWPMTDKHRGPPEVDSLTWSRDGRFIHSYGRNTRYEIYRI